MRKDIIRNVAALAAVTFAIPLLAQPVRCTQETVSGTYALSYEGTVLVTAPGTSQPVPVPGVGLAVVSIDSAGAIWAAGIQTIGGTSVQFPFVPSGTMAVNSDCTGAVNWGLGMGTATMVILGEGQELNTMMTQCGPAVGGPCIIYGTWKRISRTPATVVPAQCSPGSVVGTYTVRQHGNLMSPQAGSTYLLATPGTLVGVASIGSDGSVKAAGTASVGGRTMPFGMAGNLQMKSDCTATVTATLTSQGVTMGQGQGWYVVVDGGNQLFGIEVQNPMGQPVTLGTMTRISTMPSASK
ncbi:MAG TPA: hypothetical protein VLY04_25555 [Bryobacteraceae bacterium]|nr:hypothetical protein [Bryobacteraceae bacterium]